MFSSVNGQMVSTLDFMDHTASITATQLCHNSVRQQMNMACVPIKLSLQKVHTRLDVASGL